MGWRNNIFKFLPIKYVNSHEMALGMSMLACFWGGNLYNLFGKHKPKWGARKLWISEARQSLSLPHQMYQKIEEKEYKILEKKLITAKIRVVAHLAIISYIMLVCQDIVWNTTWGGLNTLAKKLYKKAVPMFQNSPERRFLQINLRR